VRQLLRYNVYFSVCLYPYPQELLSSEQPSSPVLSRPVNPLFPLNLRSDDYHYGTSQSDHRYRRQLPLDSLKHCFGSDALIVLFDFVPPPDRISQLGKRFVVYCWSELVLVGVKNAIVACTQECIMCFRFLWCLFFSHV